MTDSIDSILNDRKKRDSLMLKIRSQESIIKSSRFVLGSGHKNTKLGISQLKKLKLQLKQLDQKNTSTSKSGENQK